MPYPRRRPTGHVCECSIFRWATIWHREDVRRREDHRDPPEALILWVEGGGTPGPESSVHGQCFLAPCLSPRPADSTRRGRAYYPDLAQVPAR